jgi:hypothetical protein
MDLLKAYVLHKLEESRNGPGAYVAGGALAASEACTVMNAHWVMPWLWERKDMDLGFVRLVTTACVRFSGFEDLRVDYPMSKVVDGHAESVYEIFQVSG